MNLYLQAAVQNRLLSMLPSGLYTMLAPHLELVDFPLRFHFSAPDAASDYSYFIETGVASVVADGAEVGLIGREGMTNPSLVFRVNTTPFAIFMQIAGNGFLIESARLAVAMEQYSILRDVILEYAYSLSVQTCFSARANSKNDIGERLARWILMCHDRASGDDMALTHEFISMMLGVRRPSVTDALHGLEGASLIYSARRQVTVRDRQGLEAFAGGSYGQPQRKYSRILASRQAANIATISGS